MRSFIVKRTGKMLIRNPFVWLRRILHRRGYGIHSPFAYSLVTQVLYTPGEYYADERLYPCRERLMHPRRTAVHRLMFRLANHWQPTVVSAPAELHPYLHEGCRRAQLQACPEPLVTFDGGQGRMVALVDLQHHREAWRRLKDEPQVTVTFDLYDVGLAICNPKLQHHDYIINW